MIDEIFNKVKASFEATQVEVLFVTSDGQCFHKSGSASNHANTLARSGKDGNYIKVFADQMEAIEKQMNAHAVEEEELEPAEEVVETPEAPAVEKKELEPAEEVVETPEAPAVEKEELEPVEEVVETPEAPAVEKEVKAPKAKATKSK